MKVLLFCSIILHKGGADRVILEIAKRFNAPIYTSKYVKETAFEEFAELDIRVIKQSIFEKPFLSLRKNDIFKDLVFSGLKFLNYKVKEDYDVINAHGHPANWIRNRNERVCWYFYSPLRRAFDLYNYKVAILPFHKKLFNDLIFTGYKFWEKRIDPKIEKTVSVSSYVNERDKKFIDEYIKKPVESIPPGVNEKDFYNEGYDKYFLYFSRICPEKRFEYAIDAFRQFSKKKKGWKLVIAGLLSKREKERKYAEMLIEMCTGLNVKFEFNLSNKELNALYANSYAGLFCAINEDWGLPPLEIMASEKPCISVNEGGPKCSILDRKTGFLVDSPEEMAEKMIYLAENPNENEKMGKLARVHVLKNYTWKIFLDKMEKAFKETSIMKSESQTILR